MSSGAHTSSKRTRSSLVETGEGRGRPIVFSYVPALDGLRAVAVLGRLLYHGGAPVAVGGFLGVDVFFVLSGFLITSLLLGEWAKLLTISLGEFWARRARRLLPALLVMLVGVALFVKVFAGPGEFAESASTRSPRCSMWPTGTSSSVAAATSPRRPSPHRSSTCGPSPSRSSSTSSGPRWSCSCSAWAGSSVPPGACGPSWPRRWSGRWRRPSTCACRYQGGASVMRLYEGTDTRSQDMLVGAALACGMAMWAQHRKALPVVEMEVPNSRSVARAHPAAGTAGAFPPDRSDATCTVAGALGSDRSKRGRSRPARSASPSRSSDGRPWPSRSHSAGG